MLYSYNSCIIDCISTQDTGTGSFGLYLFDTTALFDYTFIFYVIVQVMEWINMHSYTGSILMLMYTKTHECIYMSEKFLRAHK